MKVATPEPYEAAELVAAIVNRYAFWEVFTQADLEQRLREVDIELDSDVLAEALVILQDGRIYEREPGKWSRPGPGGPGAIDPYAVGLLLTFVGANIARGFLEAAGKRAWSLLSTQFCKAFDDRRSAGRLPELRMETEVDGVTITLHCHNRIISKTQLQMAMETARTAIALNQLVASESHKTPSGLPRSYRLIWSEHRSMWIPQPGYHD